MTKVLISKKDEYISSVNISGHAFFADYGNDIVCSAISMLCYTIGNKLLELKEENVYIKIDEGYFNIEIFETNHDNQLLLDTLILGFRMIEEQYGNTIRIKEIEHV